MARTPIDRFLDQVKWTALDGDGWVVASGHETELPYATHEGWLEIMGGRLHVYQLSDGQRVFEAESFTRFWNELTGE